MTVTTAMQSYINEFSAKTGLDKSVVTVWAQAENGGNNNVLGVTSGSGLLSFTSPTAGADAAANLVNTSSNYAGIRASVNQSPAAQALAIAQSPWRLGGSGLKTVGGTDPYYYNQFVGAGIISGSTISPGQVIQNTVTSAYQNVSPANVQQLNQNNPGGLFNIDLTSPFYFLGVILVGIVFILVGGLILVKPKAEQAAQQYLPMAAMAA